MSRHTVRAAIAGALLLIAACAGVRARDELLRPMALAFPPIAEMAERGAPEARVVEAVAGIRAALDSLNRGALLSLDWPAVRAAVEADIARRVQAGEIGIGVGQSLLERVRLFDESWTKALAR